MARTSGLADFQKFIKDVKSVGGLAGKAVLLAPPAASLLNSFGPPWPSQLGDSLLRPTAGIAAATAVVETVALILVFTASQDATSEELRLRTRRRAIGFLALLIVYLLTYVAFVADMPDSRHRDVKGLYYTPAAHATINSTYTESMALRGAAYDPTQIWAPWTVYGMRWLIVATWLAVFFFLAATIGTFVSTLYKGRSRPTTQ